MDPNSPADAQRIVGRYLEVLEAHAAADEYPGAVRDLPHSKETIRAAFRTSTTALAAAGQLTDDMRDYLEVAYVSLADYVEDEAVALLREYRQAGEALAADPRLPREKASTDAWRRIADQSRQLAHAISVEADRLRGEFRSWRHAHV